jgi:hypothetical protein
MQTFQRPFPPSYLHVNVLVLFRFPSRANTTAPSKAKTGNCWNPSNSGLANAPSAWKSVSKVTYHNGYTWLFPDDSCSDGGNSDIVSEWKGFSGCKDFTFSSFQVQDTW